MHTQIPGTIIFFELGVPSFSPNSLLPVSLALPLLSSLFFKVLPQLFYSPLPFSDGGFDIALESGLECTQPSFQILCEFVDHTPRAA